MGILYNKKVIIFAQGIGPIKNYFAKILTKILLKQCYYISVRDEKSFNILKAWDIPSEKICDPVYSLEIKHLEKSNSVGIQIRDFKNMSTNLLQKIALLINSKFSDKNIKIFSLQEEIDYSLCKYFNSLLNSINPNIETVIVTENITEELCSLEYLIGMRFHALLIALKAGVKTCAINYDIKVEQLAKDFGIPIISMTGEENFEEIYENLNKLNSENIIEIAASKNFDWSSFDYRIISNRLSNLLP